MIGIESAKDNIFRISHCVRLRAGIQSNRHTFNHQQNTERSMPKVSDMIESKYLRKEDIIDGEMVVTIKKIGKVNVAMDDQPEERKWVMLLAEFKKPMVLNSTNIQLLAKALGSEEANDWIDKRVILYVDDNVSFGGKLVGGIRVRAIRKPPTTPMGAVNREPGEDLEDDIPWQQ
jgi:hypothetical protein